MVNVTKLGVVLRPTELPFEKKAVLNPAVYQEGDNVHVIYRAIDDDFVSCLGYAKLDSANQVIERWDKPFMSPKLRCESKGIEDPRIVKIENTFYMTYVVHDGKHAISAFSCGDNILDLSRGHVISPKIPYKDAGKMFSYTKLKDEYYFFESFYQKYNGPSVYIWHKDCILFPEKIDGRYAMLQRILPDIQMVYFDDWSQLKDKYFWINNLMHLSENVVLEGMHGFESRHVGGGVPPIKTEAGWLMIYHGAIELNKKRTYHAGAALLDLQRPEKVIARLPYPLFSPTEKFEIEGTVNDVVFPTGAAVFGQDIIIYYGAADTLVAAAKVNLQELIDELLKNKV